MHYDSLLFCHFVEKKSVFDLKVVRMDDLLMKKCPTINHKLCLIVTVDSYRDELVSRTDLVKSELLTLKH